MSMNSKAIAFVLVAAALAQPGLAAAAPPESVVGTWLMQNNQAEEQLVVTNQGGPGSPAGETCRQIDGTLGVAPMQGFYCPDTGRIHMLHKNVSTKAVVRVFTGNLSDSLTGHPDRMAGTMTVVNIAFGPFGEFSFSASK
jgi:hypothetical protein